MVTDFLYDRFNFSFGPLVRNEKFNPIRIFQNFFFLVTITGFRIKRKLFPYIFLANDCL